MWRSDRDEYPALSPTGASIGIGFAVPANLIKKIVPDLIEQRHADHLWLGIEIIGEVTTLVARERNLPTPGILFRPVPNVPDSPVR
jgi:serine protease Do